MAAKKTRRVKAQMLEVLKCADVKAALAKELKAQVKDKTLRDNLLKRLAGEVAYGTGGGGGGVGMG